MDPDLQDISAEDFEAVQQFLQSGEFEPMYIRLAEDARIASGNSSLEGDRDCRAEYIRRLGKALRSCEEAGIGCHAGLGVQEAFKAGFPDGWEPRVMLGMTEQVWAYVPRTMDDPAMIAGTGRRMS